ncbi:MAG TPA: PBP1A family penicillin-binding protein [Longimicrobiales bacterium]
MSGTGARPVRRTGQAVLAVLTVVVAGAGVLLFTLYTTCGLRGCPDVRLLRGYVPAEASVVLDRHGEELIKLFRVRRVVVPLDSLPDYVPLAFVAIEDRRFFEHDGVDWTRAAGAAWANLQAGGIEEGFSTITMQLARNLFPEQLPARERTLGRKLGEIHVARAIERAYDKDEILELYINQIYFGSGAWGVEAAAREYFGKPAAELALAEAALLAGIVRAPSRLNPRVNRDAALARRRLVLRRMAAEGYIDAAEAEEAADARLRLARGVRSQEMAAPYFLEEVRKIVEERFGEAVYTGGLRIRTTLDRRVQAVAEAELERQLDEIEAGRYGRFRHPRYGERREAGDTLQVATRYLQGAVVVMDVATGDVLALVGGRDFDDSRFDRAVQAWRQPGSAFKPFVYAAAVEEGYPPTHILEDSPLRLVQAGGQVWAPRNFGGGYSGPIPMREALVHSKNIATVRLALEIGIRDVVQTARRLGLSGPLPPYPSTAIGAGGVTLLEMTAAYTAFGGLGRRVEPRFILRVEDRAGRVLWRPQVRARQVLHAGAAFLVLDMMRDVVDRGTGTAVRAAGFVGPAAGKTGTTNDATDVWFIGVTPSLAAGVWIGMDRPQPIVPGATGGRLAAPVWGRVMRRLPRAAAPDWTPPPGVETRYVDATGAVLDPGCWAYPPVRTEYFLAGTAPGGRCRGAVRTAVPDSVLMDSLLGVDEEAWRRQQMMRRGLPGDSAWPPPGRATDWPDADAAGDSGAARRPPDDGPPDDGRLEPRDRERGRREEEGTRDRRPPRLLGRPGPPVVQPPRRGPDGR